MLDGKEVIPHPERPADVRFEKPCVVSEIHTVFVSRPPGRECGTACQTRTDRREDDHFCFAHRGVFVYPGVVADM